MCAAISPKSTELIMHSDMIYTRALSPRHQGIFSVKYAEHGPVFVSSIHLVCWFVLRLYGANLIWIIPAKGSCLPTPATTGQT